MDEIYTPSSLSNLTLRKDSDGFKKFSDLLNKLDVFAAAFVRGVADSGGVSCSKPSASSGFIDARTINR